MDQIPGTSLSSDAELGKGLDTTIIGDLQNVPGVADGVLSYCYDVTVTLSFRYMVVRVGCQCFYCEMGEIPTCRWVKMTVL